LISGILKLTIDSDIKVLNHILLTLASDHGAQVKNKTFIHNSSLKINWLNQLIMKLAINKTFTLKLVLSGNKFGLAGNILACLTLSANITIHNVVTRIINEPLPDIVEFTQFNFRT
jgi:hypothetical protein